MIGTYQSDFTNLRDLLEGLASSMNLISHETAHHHETTAYLSYQIALAMNLPEEERKMAVYTSLLHDIGAIAEESVPSVADLENDRFRISRIGAAMLKDIDMLREIADYVEFCQISWQDLCGIRKDRLKMQYVPSVVHLADTIATMLNEDMPILNQVTEFRSAAMCMRGTEFAEAAVDGFLKLCSEEYVWMDAAHNPEYLRYFAGKMRTATLRETLELTKLMSRMIDYRSPFTAMHSSGVSASAAALAELCGMSENECMMMEIAGNLHDIGKLKVPRAILEKPGKLTEEEFNIIKEHPYYTRDILMKIEGFDEIADWAGFHHEKLDGTGYPFHLTSDDLGAGCRIMAVADVFSAIAEERPYRKPMGREKTITVLREDADRRHLAKPIVDVLIKNYEYIDQRRDTVSHAAGRHYFETLKESEADLS